MEYVREGGDMNVDARETEDKDYGLQGERKRERERERGRLSCLIEYG